jgi:hypothetical protein
MPYQPLFRSAEQGAVLSDALKRCRSAGPGALAVFDLDGCLFDNRIRQIRVIREYALRTGVFELWRIGEEHIFDWRLERTLENAGLDRSLIREVLPGLKDFWSSRFHAVELLFLDVAMPGAADFVLALARTGATPVYLTGRMEGARKQTEDALLRYSFPLRSAHLVMRQQVEQDEIQYKKEAFGREPFQRSPAVCFFDNHPANLNFFHHRFPDALAVLVDTGHDPESTALEKGLARILGFLV